MIACGGSCICRRQRKGTFFWFHWDLSFECKHERKALGLTGGKSKNIVSSVLVEHEQKTMTILVTGFAILPNERNNGEEEFTSSSAVMRTRRYIGELLSYYFAMAGQDMIDFFAKEEASKRQQGNANADRISILPQEILCHIISLIPTLFAISTSAVSKRWNNLWTNSNSIEFDDSLLACSLTLNKPKSFSKFGDNVFKLNRVNPLKKFSLTCDEHDCGEPTYTNWICAASARNPEEMNIRIHVGNPFALPASLFTCGRLVILKLSATFLVSLPDKVHFPNLTTLHLCIVRFVGDDPMEKFLSGCPLLKELFLGEVTFEKFTKLSFISPSLERLRVILSFVGDQYMLIMDTPQLKKLVLNVLNLKGIETTEMPHLREAFIHVSPTGRSPLVASKELAPGMLNLLSNISGVDILNLAWNADVYIGRAFDHMLPAHRNLTLMEVQIFGSWQLMTYLLGYIPNLRILHCHMVRRCNVSREARRRPTFPTCIWHPPHNVPVCLPGLETIEFTINGCVTEIQLIGYLLQNASRLRRFAIRRSEHFVNRWNETILEELHQFKRGSVECQVVFPKDGS